MKLAVKGSCATRAVLEVGEQQFALEYHARTSWDSQASMPQPAPVPMRTGAGFGERMVREDLTKGGRRRPGREPAARSRD